MVVGYTTVRVLQSYFTVTRFMFSSNEKLGNFCCIHTSYLKLGERGAKEYGQLRKNNSCIIDATLENLNQLPAIWNLRCYRHKI